MPGKKYPAVLIYFFLKKKKKKALIDLLIWFTDRQTGLQAMKRFISLDFLLPVMKTQFGTKVVVVVGAGGFWLSFLNNSWLECCQTWQGRKKLNIPLHHHNVSLWFSMDHLDPKRVPASPRNILWFRPPWWFVHHFLQQPWREIARMWSISSVNDAILWAVCCIIPVWYAPWYHTVRFPSTLSAAPSLLWWKSIMAFI